MSKGNPIIKARVPRDLLAAIDSSVAALPHERGVCHTRSTFIVEAIRSKLREESGASLSYVEVIRAWRRELAREKYSLKKAV